MRGIAAAVVVLLVAEIGTLLAHAFARLREAGLADELRTDPGSVSLDRVQASDDLVRMTNVAATAMGATVNARRWDPTVKHKPWIAVAGWIIPFVSLVVPWKVLGQALRVGARRVRTTAGTGGIALWVLLQYGGVVVTVVGALRYGVLMEDARLRSVPIDLEAATTAMRTIALGMGVSALSLVCGIAVVLRIASLHDRTVTV
jgi:hypothetical protein